MSKFFLAGVAGIAILGGLAVVPQISSAAGTPAAITVAPATASPATAAGSKTGYFSAALEPEQQAVYKTCFMKRTVTFTAEGAKAVMTPTCTR